MERGNSQRSSVRAFSSSFSCGEFGAFDLDLDEDDYEAMAAEAEAEARAKICNSKGKARDAEIDALLESDEDDKCDKSPPARGLAGLRKSLDNKSIPQIILEKDEEDEEGGGDDDGERRSNYQRNDSKNSSLQGSFTNFNGGTETGISSNNTTATVIQTDDKSDIVLPSTGSNSAAIHINAPNVTINYIIEQKGDNSFSSMLPAMLAREASENTCTTRENSDLSESDPKLAAQVPKENLRKGSGGTVTDTEPRVLDNMSNVGGSNESQTTTQRSRVRTRAPHGSLSSSGRLDISRMLDSLWSPANPAEVDARSHSSGGSGVYSAGCSDKNDIVSNKDAAKSSHSSRARRDHKQSSRRSKKDQHSNAEVSGKGDEARLDSTNRRNKLRRAQSKSSSNEKTDTSQPSHKEEEVKKSNDKSRRKPPQSSAEELGLDAENKQTLHEQNETIENKSTLKRSLRDSLATLPKWESDKSLSVYEDGGSVQTSDVDNVDALLKKRGSTGLQMGAIAEVDGDSSTASGSGRGGPDQEISDFAKNFVDQFSRRASVASSSSREIGSDINAEKPGVLRRASSSSIPSRRSSIESTQKVDKDMKVAPPKLTRSLNQNGKNQLRKDIDALDETPKLARRTKSMKVPKNSSNLLSEDDKQGMKLMKKWKSQKKTLNAVSQEKSVDCKYAIGDILSNEGDVIRDSKVENLLAVEVFEYVFVRRSGGKWACAIVCEKTDKHMIFVLDKTGAKKKIPRSSLLHNVRRLDYARCFKQFSE